MKLAVLVLEKRLLQCKTGSLCFGKKVAYNTDTSSGLFGKTVAASLNGQILFRNKVAATGQFLLVERKLLQC